MKLDEPNIRERVYEVDHNFDGWRLDQFLSNRMSRLSRSRAGEIAKHGDVEVEPPRKVKAGTKLRVGDVVTIREHLPPETVQDDEVEILYEDSSIVVVNKPAGMLVHEAAWVRLNTIQGFLERHGYEGAEPTHRIDRETSGVLVCAAAPEMVPVLREMFAGPAPEKVYRALALDPDCNWSVGQRETIDIPLRLAAERRLAIRMIRGDLSATTHFECIGIARHGSTRLADLEVRIETGRQHQIRVHLEFFGTPIAGDKLYGRPDEFFMAIQDYPDDDELNAQLLFDRHALHAWKIEFPHPRTGQTIEVEAPLAEPWREVERL